MVAVLLLDADPEHVEAQRSGLEACGHVVIPAVSARSGVARLREGGIDVVVVDPGLPGGVESLILGLTALPDPLPVIVVSGAADAPRMSARLGAVAFLPKPCDVHELALAIGEAADFGEGSGPVQAPDPRA